jgi:hypothetical protein
MLNTRPRIYWALSTWPFQVHQESVSVLPEFGLSLFELDNLHVYAYYVEKLLRVVKHTQGSRHVSDGSALTLWFRKNFTLIWYDVAPSNQTGGATSLNHVTRVIVKIFEMINVRAIEILNLDFEIGVMRCEWPTSCVNRWLIERRQEGDRQERNHVGSHRVHASIEVLRLRKCILYSYLTNDSLVRTFWVQLYRGLTATTY